VTSPAPLRRAAERTVSALLLGWLAASTIEQLRHPRLQHFRKFDVFGLVPVWTFFAPNPGSGDFFVVYRDELYAGSRTIWREVATPQSKGPTASIWHPDRRLNKALFDVGQSLMLDVSRCKGDEIQLSLAYLSLLTHVCSNAPHEPSATATQFMLLSDNELPKGEDPAPVFLSEWHAL
jgi:hypothetical protein